MFGKRKNRDNNYNKGYNKKNPSGHCICPQCNYSVSHNRGVPCFTLICPTCKVPLVKQKRFVNDNNKNGSVENTIISDHPKVDIELCIGCLACINECLIGAIIFEDGKAKILNEKCMNCRACVDACPAEAIN